MTVGIATLPLLAGLLGGLALFLYGMDQLADALRGLAGDRMRTLIARLTTNRWKGALTGAVATAILQSSSVTTVLVVGFATAGLMTTLQSVGVIIGANVGTTVTAQIVAFHVTEYALILVALGFGLVFFGRRERWKLYGTAILGLGIVFLGMREMGDAMAPLRTHQPFLDVMAALHVPVLGVLAGAVFTAIVQSSSATTGVVIVLSAQGVIPLDAGILLVLGANVGTCVTALLAALRKPREAQRAALIHVLFNVLGVAVWIAFVPWLEDLVRRITPADTARQLANAHTVFNVANALLFLPLAGVLDRTVHLLRPDRPSDAVDPGRPRYLDASALATPSIALDRARMETLRLGDRARAMLEAALPAVLEGPRAALDRIAAMDDAIDRLYGRIVTYLGDVGREALTAEQTADLVRLMEAAHDLENIGDIVETNLVALGRRRLDQGVKVSPATRQVLRDFHAEVMRAFDAALTAVAQRSEEAARVVVGMKPAINRMAEAAAEHGADRLVAPEPHRLPAYAIELDVMESLKRVYYFAKRMARVVVPSRREG